MAQLPKQKIAELRSAGFTYAKIGELLGISENSVKSFCQRNKLGGRKNTNSDIDVNVNTCCTQCGEKFVIFGRSTKKFCSSKCRNDWWNAHPEKRNGRGLQKHICKHCGNEFSHYGDRVYCGHSCYISARFKNDTRAI